VIVGLVGVPANAVITGAVIGLTYALLAAGLLLIYRATRVINFAAGQIGTVCAFVLAKLVVDLHWNYFVAFAIALILGGAIGGIVELIVIRRLFQAPRLQLFVATLGIAELLLVVQYLLPKVRGVGVYPSPLSWIWTVGGVQLTSPDIMVILIAPPAVLAVGLFLTRTWAGLSIRATSDNADMSDLSGMSPRRVSTMVWIIAGVLAALTSSLLNPLLGTVLNAPSAELGPSLLLPALVAMLVGGLTSLPLTLLGGIGIGIVQSVLVVNFPSTPGVVELLLFIGIVVLVLVRPVPRNEDLSGQWSLALRVPPTPARVEEIWWAAHLRQIVVGAVLAVAIALPVVFSSSGTIFVFSDVIIVGLAGLSVTVLTGWAGQLSLGQFAFVGLGAVTASALVSRGFSFPVAAVCSVAAGAVVALMVGFPALRARGLFLAVTTLAFAVMAQAWLFRLSLFNGGNALFFHLPRSELFGFINLQSERTYYYMCLVVLAATAAAVSRLRRTGVGRAFVAVKDNESCAASFGTSVAITKLTAFAFAGALAALAGVLYAGLNVYFNIDSGTGQPAPFDATQSLQLVAMAVIGGLGSVGGVLVGAIYVVGLPALFSNNPLVGFASSGIGLLFLLIYVPGGLASIAYRVRDALFALALRGRPAALRSVPAMARPLPVRQTKGEKPLEPDVAPTLEVAPAVEVADIQVSFGGILALFEVSMYAGAGEIVGLIGSNGAGKSTLMNVIGGFQPSVTGTVRFWGRDATLLRPHERARLGVSRVFQDARLFGDLVVRETVELALEVHGRSKFVTSLVGYPSARRTERQRASEAAEFIDFLGLGRYSDAFIADLSTGTRRIVEMCCLLARGSRLLLLDEPTAGVAQREAEAFRPLIQRVRAELDATVVIIEHDMTLVMSISDRVYCLDNGQVIAQGEPDTVRRDPSVIAAYMGTNERAIERSDVPTAAVSRQQTISPNT
jgi:ABC-type branched-subunit amino acid transport system ATPase component/ABC-type branched-subunit amino acid transport system permease subunit